MTIWKYCSIILQNSKINSEPVWKNKKKYLKSAFVHRGIIIRASLYLLQNPIEALKELQDSVKSWLEVLEKENKSYKIIERIKNVPKKSITSLNYIPLYHLFVFTWGLLHLWKHVVLYLFSHWFALLEMVSLSYVLQDLTDRHYD